MKEKIKTLQRKWTTLYKYSSNKQEKPMKEMV